MSSAQYDVIVVGAGCAGLTAAIGLARAGFTTIVVEAAAMPGGAGDLGGICFVENLAQPDILGPDGVESLAWERRLIERGSFVTDGRRLAGSTYRDPDTFHDCYTVLRPLFDHHLGQLARAHGVALLTGTVVEGLIRDGRRIIGVSTSRGALYGELVFLAEGDAGHLVTREGLDRSSDPREAPAFLYGLQQVLELPPGAIEDSFRVGPEQGVAYDLLLRNVGDARLNARGFVYTNRQSLTLSLLLPAAHLQAHFRGSPRRLLEWFADMPALRPWLRAGQPGAWTAHLIRASGLRDVPYLVEDGLVVGGAAAGLGVDFPHPNATGPATATGLLLCRAAAAIRAEGGDFHRAQLIRHYVEPLRRTCYWRDVEFLQRWPGYLRRTRVLFDQGLDLLLDSAEVWARPRRWLPVKLLSWFRVLGRVRWAQWAELQQDLAALGHALRLREVLPRPALARVLLDGALNAFRDLARRPRPHLPPGGSLSVHYAAENGMVGATPALLRRWLERFRPVLGSAGRLLYRNDDMPLSAKGTATVELLLRQINLLDLLALAVLGFIAVLASMALDACASVFRRFSRHRGASSDVATMDIPKPRGAEEVISTTTHPPIHLIWRSTQPEQRAESARSLLPVCPTGVFELHDESPGPVGVVVHGEKCIACEACWRTNPSVDWARGGPPPLPAPVLSPVITRLLAAEDHAGLVRPALALRLDPWPTVASRHADDDLARLLDQLEDKLGEFEYSLARQDAIVDRPRGDHLEMLARYAHQLARLAHETLRESTRPDNASIREQALNLAAALIVGTEARTRRTWEGRFAWAAADGRLLRQHHLIGLRRLLGLTTPSQPRGAIPATLAESSEPSSTARPLPAQDACAKHLLAEIAARRFLLSILTEAPETKEPTRAELLAALAEEIAESLKTIKSCSSDHQNILNTSSRPSEAAEEAYRRFGSQLLAEEELLDALLDVQGDWPTLAQRRALLAEREEVFGAEKRLAELTHAWRDALRERADDPMIRSGFGRKAAHVLAGKRLLLHTHDLLERGLDAELAIVLLRVWLDYAATLLDEFTIAVRDRLRPSAPAGIRPLVDPGSGAPLASLADFRDALDSYTAGDFLLDSLDLLQPRLVPEMVESHELTTALQTTFAAANEINKPASGSSAENEIAKELLRLRGEILAELPNADRPEEARFLTEAVTLEMIGRCLRRSSRAWPLEMACACLILADLRQPGAALRERCEILRVLAEDVMPRCRHGDPATGVRHLAPEVLELEALKTDYRRRLTTVDQVFGAALGRNADVQASCFALAEAAAWIKAADSVLGRMAWLVRLAESDEREEPALRLDLGRRVLTHCHAEVRDRLFRFDEDLAALRRGYYAPHVRAAALLLQPRPKGVEPTPTSDIRRPLRVLVVVEPMPAEPAGDTDRGGRVLETLWALGDADRSTLENALRLRDAAPAMVRVEVASLGPPRVGQALREVLSLGIERIHLAIPRQGEATPDRAAAALAGALESAGPFDLILGGAHAGDRLTARLADALHTPVSGRAASVTVRMEGTKSWVRMISPATTRERLLPAAVFLGSGTPLRPFSISDYLAGLQYAPQIVAV